MFKSKLLRRNLKSPALLDSGLVFVYLLCVAPALDASNPRSTDRTLLVGIDTIALTLPTDKQETTMKFVGKLLSLASVNLLTVAFALTAHAAEEIGRLLPPQFQRLR